MPIQMTTQVGAPSASRQLGAQAQPIARSGGMAEIIMGKLHGDGYEGNYQRTRFGGAMQAVLATATIAGLSTSITGVSVLYNPPGSGILVSLERVGIGFVLAPAAPLVYGLATGFNSATALSGTLTTLTPKSKNIGSGAAPLAGLAASAAITLPTVSTVDTVLGQLDTGAVATVTAAPGVYDLRGSILLPPGGFVHLWTSAVLLASAHIMSWDWEEIPYP